MKTLLLFAVTSVALAHRALCGTIIPSPATSQDDSRTAQIEKYNVVWDSPSRDCNGSMPIGNGDIGANAWVEPNGDLVLLLSKTDSLSANGWLLKLGEIRLRMEPALVQKGAAFRQELDLKSGTILITSGDVTLSVWVDAQSPVVRVKMDAATPRKVSVMHESWRMKRYETTGADSAMLCVGKGGKDWSGERLWMEPDTVVPGQSERIVFYHRNTHSIWAHDLKGLNLSGWATLGQDPLLNRTFGALVQADGLRNSSDQKLETVTPVRALNLNITALTATTETPELWIEALESTAKTVRAMPLANARKAHEQWWQAFWSRSWIAVTESAAGRRAPLNKWAVRVGADQNNGNRLNGQIGPLRLYTSALSEAQIAAHAGIARDAEVSVQDDSVYAGTLPLGDTITGSAPWDFSGGLTVEAWVRASGTGRIADKATPSVADGWLLDMQPGNTLRLIVGKAILKASVMPQNEWTHVAATASTDGVLKLYVSGKRVGEQAPSGDAFTVSQGYALQRFITACGGRGNMPIRFNGSIFTVKNRDTGGIGGEGKGTQRTHDYRRWGSCMWWQNTRHAYWPLMDSGDFEMMLPLFKTYAAMAPLRKYVTQQYYGHDGMYYDETMYPWGVMNPEDYGTGAIRKDKPDGWVELRDLRYYWQGGLENLAMMIRYYNYTADDGFLRETLLPFAHGIITFYDLHYERDASGKILFTPANALEDVWECKNPAPEIAGLKANITALIKLTDNAEHRGMYVRMLSELPALPMATLSNGVDCLLACLPDGGRMPWQFPKAVRKPELNNLCRKYNTEKPELYSLFPHLLYGVGRPGLDAVREAWKRSQKTYGPTHKPLCWNQDTIFLACMGLTEGAKKEVVARAKGNCRLSRFPAFWGPNFDWFPDQDHGGVMQVGLQKMLMQPDLPCNSRNIWLLPAWPKEWDVRFKLHAPFETTVECEVRNGKVVKLVVTPESRKKDVEICGEFAEK